VDGRVAAVAGLISNSLSRRTIITNAVGHRQHERGITAFALGREWLPDLDTHPQG
jgi:hypothetical protein